jgi:hypothetical protein
MSQTPSTQVDLAKLFNTVTQTLKENQDSLNATDDYNHNHGDNMVDNFQVITKAMRETKGSAPADQLAYASQMLSQFSQSGSAQLYSQGLAQAAQSFQGKPAVTPNDAMLLVQSLMGGQPGASQSGGGSAADLLGGLLGGAPGGAPVGGAQSQTPGGDLLGGLLGALMGGQGAAAAGTEPQGPEAQSYGAPAAGAPGALPGGIDMNTLLTAGMAFFQARQLGAAPVDALVQAVMAGSQMQGSAHHSQSGQLVATTLINTLGSMLSGRK